MMNHRIQTRTRFGRCLFLKNRFRKRIKKLQRILRRRSSCNKRIKLMNQVREIFTLQYLIVINDSAESSFNFYGRDLEYTISDELRYKSKVNNNNKRKNQKEKTNKFKLPL